MGSGVVNNGGSKPHRQLAMNAVNANNSIARINAFIFLTFCRTPKLVYNEFVAYAKFAWIISCWEQQYLHLAKKFA